MCSHFRPRGQGSCGNGGGWRGGRSFLMLILLYFLSLKPEHTEHTGLMMGRDTQPNLVFQLQVWKVACRSLEPQASCR